MSLARPARPRVDPDPGVLAENRGRPAANVAAMLGLHPELGNAFRTLAGFIVNEASTPRRQRELVILRTGWNCGAQYEFGQHTRLGREAGITEAEIVALTRPLTTFPWAEDDNLLLEMADELYTDFCVTDATWARLATRWSPSPGFSRGFGGCAARLNRKVLLTWDDKGCLGPYHSGFEEHFLRARYRMVAWS